MRFNKHEPEASGYFVRRGPDEPERGRLTSAQLCDLAEFGNITPDWLVRAAPEETSRPIREVPELMAELFPEKKTFQFKTYERADNPDAGRPPVDVRGLYRCEADAPEEGDGDSLLGAEASALSLRRPMPPERRTPPPLPGAPGAFDVKAILQASEAIAQQRGGNKVDPGRASFSSGRVSLVVRWVFATVFALIGIYVLGASGSWRMAIPLFGLALMLVVLDFIGWMFDGLEQWIANAAGKPPDFTQAEDRLRAGEWAAAASAFLIETKRNPKQIRGYFAGISAAFAARDGRLAAAFHSLAHKHLGTHDLNLLNGALRRSDIPPVPPSKKESKRQS